jgi:hypothetical protein
MDIHKHDVDTVVDCSSYTIRVDAYKPNVDIDVIFSAGDADEHRPVKESRSTDTREESKYVFLALFVKGKCKSTIEDERRTGRNCKTIEHSWSTI